MDQPTYEIRSLFLREFAKQLIINYPLTPEPYLPAEQIQTEPLIQIPSAPTTVAQVQSKEFTASPQLEERHSALPERELYETQGPQRITAIKEIESPPVAPSMQHASTMPLYAMQRKQALPKAPQLSHLDQWLSDQAIESVECTGPDQNLIVKRNGNITQSSLRLQKEEIKTILEDLAAKAHAPFEEGILKTETKTWSVIGVLSEFGGSRFLLQKKKLERSTR